eukprot:4269613-Pleurochrysis_carterae.AAC.1
MLSTVSEREGRGQQDESEQGVCERHAKARGEGEGRGGERTRRERRRWMERAKSRRRLTRALRPGLGHCGRDSGTAAGTRETGGSACVREGARVQERQ